MIRNGVLFKVMDFLNTKYEFLDLSDVKESDLCSLKSALLDQFPETYKTDPHTENIDPSQEICRYSPGVNLATVSGSVEQVGGDECEMAPHSPARAGGGVGPPQAGPPAHLPSAPGPPPPSQPPYPAPAPTIQATQSHYGHPPPQQWPVAPPNVYVSQVTANVNVHGYMGQYYQPPQHQFVPPQTPDRPGRNHNRANRNRNKRMPSPPPAQPPPYYMPYPQYYPAAQAQGAPLYHMPMYQPVTYVGPYPYAPYYPDYPLAVEEGEKPPDEYTQEMMMEQEAVEAYYAGTPYGPPYAPPPDNALEYMPPMYLPPPPHAQPMHIPHQPQQHQHQPVPHQFNVHAKNFVLSTTKTQITHENKHLEQKTPIASAASISSSVESLPIKELKISKEPGSPKHTEKPLENLQVKAPASQNDKMVPKPLTDAPKPAWAGMENKTDSQSQMQPLIKSFPNVTTGHLTQPGQAKVSPPGNKGAKGPAPFTTKQANKSPTMTQAPVSMSQVAPKVPFPNRQKRDGPQNRSPDGVGESLDHLKREMPLPPSKAPMPISITLQSQGPPLIISNKPPFSHSRKTVPVPEPAPVPQPPPPAPTASDFPPPPTPRNRGEPTPTPPVHQPQPAPGKSWASLFSSKPSATVVSPTPNVVEDIQSPLNVASNQRPIAKVPPFDASPLQQTGAAEKMANAPRAATNAPSVASYSEKTSANSASSNTVSTSGSKSVSPCQSQSDVKEVQVQVQKEMPLPTPSPYADDPNSYRMGEFLSKYQLDNRPVALLPRGLTNRSNYCYVNAILQAMIACPPFYNMLKALPYQTRRGKSSTPIIDAMVELCYEFTPLGVGGARVSRGGGAREGGLPVQWGPALDPAAGQKVLRALRPFPGSQDTRQEDAEEFLTCLLNGLNDEMLELMKLVTPEDSKEPCPSQNGVVQAETLADEEDDDDEWKVMGPKNKGAVERLWAAGRTPLADIFRGRTRCRLHRAHHHDVTDAVQPFFTLQLDIERANSVKEALELVAGRDAVEGVTDAWQQLSIEQLPVVLLLHLKCFQIDAEGHTAKIHKSIEFTIDLKIDPKIMSSKIKYATKQRMYKLFAVVYHEGVEAVKGHYLTDTYHGQAGWIRYDDSTVTLVNDAQVLKPKPPRMPYLLMYRRQDTMPAPAHPHPHPHRVKPE